MMLLLLLQEKVYSLHVSNLCEGSSMNSSIPGLASQTQPTPVRITSVCTHREGLHGWVWLAKPKPFGREESQLQLQHTVCPVAPDYSSIILKYHEAYMTVVRTSVNMITLLQQELSYQIKPHQLMCYRLKQSSKTLICTYSRNAGSH